MIDYSNEVLNAVAENLRSLYPKIQVKGEYVDSPALFPCVTVDEISNVPVHWDSGTTNKYARVIYRVQVFSNAEAKRKEAREIYGVVDGVFQGFGLFAVTYTTTPAIYNSEVYSITATYEGVVDTNGVIYRG